MPIARALTLRATPIRSLGQPGCRRTGRPAIRPPQTRAADAEAVSVVIASVVASTADASPPDHRTNHRTRCAVPSAPPPRAWKERTT